MKHGKPGRLMCTAQHQEDSVLDRRHFPQAYPQYIPSEVLMEHSTAKCGNRIWAEFCMSPLSFNSACVDDCRFFVLERKLHLAFIATVPRKELNLLNSILSM